MVPLTTTAARHVRTWLGPAEKPGLLALRHALAYRHPGLWGDHPSAPRSVVLVREGDGRLEVFGAGEPGPAVDWLAGQRRGFILHAPRSWVGPVRARFGEVDRYEVETWATSALTDPEDVEGRAGAPASPKVVTRRLSAADQTGFAAGSPSWGLRGWQTYPALIAYGAAFGVPHGSGFAALAWVFDQADAYAALGVYTVPRFRRLGLGRAAASALVEHVESRRGKVVLWSMARGNDGSRGLARALGFVVATTEPLMRWSSGPGPGDGLDAKGADDRIPDRA